MASTGLMQLLLDLDLVDNQAVFFFEKKDWKSIVSKDTISKLRIISPTAFYIFNSQPYILFFDLTSGNVHREDEIHKQVWSFDQAPIIFIIKDNDIEIYNAFAYDKRSQRLEKISMSTEERNKEFSFWNLQSGGTWRWLQLNYYKKSIKEKRVSQKLFENIKSVRENLTRIDFENNLTDDKANTLILRLIFIRYLIDRGVKLDETYIEGTDKLSRRKSFIQLIEKPRKLNDFFSVLNNKFNGVLFKDVKFQISKEQANDLANIFSGEMPAEGSLFYGLDFYFEVFDFSIIPVELISGIYEALIDPETRALHSAVYTPSFLVDYILSNTLDKFFSKKENKKIAECKVFDPSVGSGIFLVQSFRRMVDREISLNKDLKVSKVRLREIAENNLFGIDINEQALKVTCFSIYIAILDYQDPKTILDNFHFPILIDENLFCSDFFNGDNAFNEVIKKEEVDFILGNPPWKKNKSENHLKWVNDKQIYTKKIKGELEIAQSFLLRSKEFMLPKTISALIATSTIFYNVSLTTKEFKNAFLTSFCVQEFFDLSAIKQSLFEQQESPASIVFYRLAKGDDYLKNIVRHISVKANLFTKYYKALVIEKFDQKRIIQSLFIDNDWMFKIALFGNSLDFIFLKKLEKIKGKVNDVVDEINVFKGAGIANGKGAEPYYELLNLPVIENDEIREYYTPIDTTKVLNEEDIHLGRGRRVEIFKGTKILLKEQCKDWTKPVISFAEQDSVFKKGSFAITGKNDVPIKSLYGFLIADLYLYYIFNVSCAWGVGTRPAIRFDEEFLRFPFEVPKKEVEREMIKLVNEFLLPFQTHYAPPFKMGDPIKSTSTLSKINELVNKLYHVEGYEEDLINYVLDISRYQFQESKQNKIIKRVDNDNNNEILRKYAEVFSNEFSNIYQDEFLRIDVYPIEHFIAMNFVFQKEKPKSYFNLISDITDEKKIFNALAQNISISQVSKDLHVQKDIKGFEQNSFYIIKPNEYKCWHRARAWYDVAEIKGAIENAELDYLKQPKHAS